jgi:transposase
MNDTKQGGAKRRHFDEAFKQEALRAWRSSGKSAEQVGRELGVRGDLLYKWDRASRSPRAAGAGGLPEGQAALEAEVLRLRAELARVSDQRDILKKAAGILSETPSSGMPGYRR